MSDGKPVMRDKMVSERDAGSGLVQEVTERAGGSLGRQIGGTYLNAIMPALNVASNPTTSAEGYAEKTCICVWEQREEGKEGW